jgi:FkbM family methyltransferase
MFAPAIFGTDAEAVEFLHSLPTGFFVDVGANDPVIDSQTYAFERRGWTGILVEPLPEKAHALRAQRQARVYEVVCSSPDDDGKMLTLHVAGVYSSVRPQFVVAGVTAIREIKVRASTLDNILRDAGAPIPLDFVSIDVEGHELSVLEGFDLNYWRPRLLIVEDLAMNRRLHRYLKARGYVWFRRSGLNAWFAPADAAPDVSLFGRWQYFRKHYLSLPFRHAREIKRRMFGRRVEIP